MNKYKILTFFLLFLQFLVYGQSGQKSVDAQKDELSQEEVELLQFFNPWKLIIYRPENNGDMNDIWCYLRLEDEDGNDVTYSAIEAFYEFPERNHYRHIIAPGDVYRITEDTVPKDIYFYKKSYYLSGGMAMHLLIKPGKYKISFYTPKDRVVYFPCENKEQWESNVLKYNTERPVKVIFVSPTANENGFYDGGWWVDYKAPKFFKFTIPKM